MAVVDSLNTFELLSSITVTSLLTLPKGHSGFLAAFQEWPSQPHVPFQELTQEQSRWIRAEPNWWQENEGRTRVVTLNCRCGLHNHHWFNNLGCKQPKPPNHCQEPDVTARDRCSHHQDKHSSALEPPTCPFFLQLKSRLSLASTTKDV